VESYSLQQDLPCHMLTANISIHLASVASATVDVCGSTRVKNKERESLFTRQSNTQKITVSNYSVRLKR